MSEPVLIAGAGVAGLALAQALRATGIDVQLFERSAAIRARHEGYRINLNSVGGAALARCLPAELHNLVLATSHAQRAARVTAFSHELSVLSRQELPPPADGRPHYTAVNRVTLRQIMAHGLGDALHVGREVVDAVQHEDGVEVRFADGSTTAGCLLVAADGAGSAVRRRFLPHVTLTDTGVRCLWGRTVLPDGGLPGLPEEVYDRVCVVVGPDGTVGILGAFLPRLRIEDAVARYVPGARIDPTASYLMWVLVAARDGTFGTGDRDSATLHRVATELTAGWHPAVARVIADADRDACFVQPVRVADPVAAWPVGRVTYVGDAIHAMSPAGGTGANTALQDAARLADALVSLDAGRATLTDALTRYENELRESGAAAVTRSLAFSTQYSALIANASTTPGATR